MTKTDLKNRTCIFDSTAPVQKNKSLKGATSYQRLNKKESCTQITDLHIIFYAAQEAVNSNFLNSLIWFDLESNSGSTFTGRRSIPFGQLVKIRNTHGYPLKKAFCSIQSQADH